MVHLTSITNTFFVNLLNRLGVKPPPPEGFDLINTVQPVSIVDTDIQLPVITTSMLLDVPVTTGEKAAPGAAVVLADTGALPAGTYNIHVTAGLSQTAVGSADFAVQRRDAANAANIWRQVHMIQFTGQTDYQWSAQVKLAVNERIRLITENASLATIEANLWFQQVS